MQTTHFRSHRPENEGSARLTLLAASPCLAFSFHPILRLQTRSQSGGVGKGRKMLEIKHVCRSPELHPSGVDVEDLVGTRQRHRSVIDVGYTVLLCADPDPSAPNGLIWCPWPGASCEVHTSNELQSVDFTSECPCRIPRDIILRCQGGNWLNSVLSSTVPISL